MLPGRGYARAKPIAPDEPNPEAVSKNAMRAARRKWTEEDREELWNGEPRRKAMRPDPTTDVTTVRTPRAANPPKTQALD